MLQKSERLCVFFYFVHVKKVSSPLGGRDFFEVDEAVVLG